MFATRKFGGGIKRVMERVINLINWELQTTLEDKWGCKCSYYTRKMYADTPYHSHIFICVFPELEKLYQNWKEINYYVAVKYQSKVESIIEKSNFYICMFTSEKLELEKKNQIEEDSFSAKKYVFEQKYNTDEEYQQEVERKIFKIDIQVPIDTVPKLESLTLKNFRKYEGEKVIKFNDRNGRSASFVLIYAKNGMGKTSIFDGIEFALKGEVERISKLNDKEKEKMRGPIYHHRDHSNEEAYVVINLNNGELIRRKVANLPKDGNDCRIVPANLGSEITGRKDQRKIWNQLILPHDKIDSFISAKSPTDQYKEWTDSAAPLANERGDFINSYNAFKSKKNELIKLEEKKESLERELQQVMKDKLSVQRIVEIIDKYNVFPKQSRPLFFDIQKAGTLEYDELINKVQIYEREIRNTDLEELTEKIKAAKKIQLIGIDYYLEQLDTIRKIESSIKECEDKIKRKRELNNIIQSLEKQRSTNNAIKEKLMPLESINSYGYDRVKKQLDIYQELDDQEYSFNKSLKLHSEQYEEILSRYQSVSEQLNKLMESIDEKKLQEIDSNAEKIDLNKKQLSDLERKLAKIKEQIEQKERGLLEKREKLKQIENLILPENIEEIDDRIFIDIALIFGDKLQQDLYVLKDKYRVQIQEIEIYQKQIDKINQNNKTVQDICERAKRYLQSHKDEKVCPLCHTKFESWETLISAIDNINIDNTEALSRKFFFAKYELKKSLDEYDSLLQTFQNRKCEQVEAARQDILRMENDLKSCCLKKNDFICQKNKLDQEMSDFRIWFVQQGVILDSYSLSAVKEWEKLQEEKRQNFEELRDTLQSQKDILTDSIKTIKGSINSVLQRKESLLKEPLLFSSIMFLKEKPEKYDFYKELNDLRVQDNNCLYEMEKLETQIITYNDVATDTEEKLIEDKDKQTKELEKLKNTESMSKLFTEFTEEGVKRDLNDWLQLEDSYRKQIEYLDQIQEESSARNYFEKYKDVTKQIDINKIVFESIKKETDEAKDHFRGVKETFEKSLKAYFSQNIMNEIYQKIDPHDFMKNVDYHLSFNEKDEPQLYIVVNEQIDGEADSYRPEWYFSTAQLNTVAFSSFFGRALSTESLAFRTIFVDDPISHFDDMNILGFSDMIRSIIESMDCQIIMSTHDRKIYNILRRKLDDQYYSSCFINLTENDKIKE